MRKQSISDSDLLHQTGFIRTFIRHGDVKQSVDYEKLAEFCGVAVRTVRRLHPTRTDPFTALFISVLFLP